MPPMPDDEAAANSIPLARYRFTFRMRQPVRLPELAGSTLRGSFGLALRQLSCMTKARECTGCLLLEQCAYPTVFAPHERTRQETSLGGTLRQIPVPYAIEPPENKATVLHPNQMLTFNMVLLGREALAQLPLIILAWQRALGRGITSSRSTADLEQVEWLSPADIGTAIYSSESPRIAGHPQYLVLPVFKTTQDIHLHLSTPLRIEHNKKALGPLEITPAALLRQLIRRISLVMQFHVPDSGWLPDATEVKALNALADALQDERRLHWQEWSRYSNRQKQFIELGGLVGQWRLKNVPPALLPYIYLGQWLHAGKETAFGLGRYTINSTAAPTAD